MSWMPDGKKYVFDFADITTLVSVLAVVLTICADGIAATIIFIINAIASIIYTIVKTRRINLLVLHIALLIFNIYFLVK